MAERDVTLKLKLKPATAAELSRAFAGVEEAAKKSGGIGNVFKGLTGGKRGSGLGEIFEGLGGGEGAAGAEAAGAEGATGALGALGPIALAAGVGIMAASKAFGFLKDTASQFLSTTVGLVSKANPAAVERLNMAFEDAQAVIGHALTPVVEIATDAVRLFGDTLADIMPGTNEVRDALAPLKDMMDDLRPAIAEVTPIFRDLIEVGIHGLGTALKWLSEQFHDFIAFLGIQGKLASSVGAAARPIQFGTQDQFAKQAYAAAYLASQGSSGSVKKTKTLDETIEDLKKDLGKFIDGVPTKLINWYNRQMNKLDAYINAKINEILH